MKRGENHDQERFIHWGLKGLCRRFVQPGPQGTYHFWANSGSPSPPPQTGSHARTSCLPSPAARARPGPKVCGLESESSSTSFPRSLHGTGTRSASRGSHMPTGRRPGSPAGQLPCPIQGTGTRAARSFPRPGAGPSPEAGRAAAPRRRHHSPRGRPSPAAGEGARVPGGRGALFPPGPSGHTPHLGGVSVPPRPPRAPPRATEDPLAAAAAPAAQQTPPSAPRPLRPKGPRRRGKK